MNATGLFIPAEGLHSLAVAELGKWLFSDPLPLDHLKKNIQTTLALNFLR